MTHSSPIPVAAELEQHFKRVVEGGDTTRFFQAKIVDEQIIKTHSYPASSSVANDYNAMSGLADDNEACYFLFRLNSAREWLLITWVPDGVAVKDKMVMASAKGTLKDKLGYTSIVDEAHATKKDELSYEHYQSLKSNNDSRSPEEVMREEMHQLEEKEREEQQQRPRPKTGMHAMIIPLTDEAEETVGRFKSGSINFIQFVINEDKTGINAVSPKTVNSSQIASEIHSTEPRFYLYNVPNKSPVLIYCCPERSAPKWRMVYSTAKPTLAEQIQALGVNLAPKKIEIREGSDLAEEFSRDFNRSTETIIKPASSSSLTGRIKDGGTGPDMGGVVKASKVNTVQREHPIYSLMNKGGQQGQTTKKKIVMPPPGAWN